jgi:hypothetical protein
MAHEYPLHFRAKHLFLELDARLWLVDTGSPMSFGAPGEVAIADRRFQLTPAFHGLNATSLSASVGVDCAGLLGADVLNEFDFRLDTGAQLSYLDSAAELDRLPSAGQAQDFYPGFGEFATETWQVPMTVAGAEYTIRCGVLPALLSTALSLFGTDGILGNELLEGRTVVYAPRRGAMTLAGG